MLPRSVRKWFASVTGMHGFFSGKTKKRKERFQKTEAQLQKGKKQQQAASRVQQQSRKVPQQAKPSVAETKKKTTPASGGGAAASATISKKEVKVEKKVVSPAKKETQALPEKEDKKEEEIKPVAVVVEEKKKKKPELTVRSKPDETKGTGGAVDIKSASALAMARLGIDPSKMTPPPQKRPQEKVSPEKQRRKQVEPEPVSTTQSEDLMEERLDTASEEKKEDVEEEEVDDTLARIDALLNPRAKKKPPPVAKEIGAEVRALFSACERNDVAKVKKLLETNKVDVNERDPRMDNYTALFIAVEDNDTEITDLLMEAGADIEARDGKGRTPLFAAAVSGVSAMVSHLIIKHHANPNVRDSAQHHIFWACCALSQINAARALLDAAANRGVWSIDINAKDPCGLNALDFAKARGNEEVADFLAQRGATDSRVGNVKLSAVQYELLEVDKILKS